MQRGPALMPDEITISDLTVDTRARVATRGSRRLDLTTKEFALLEFLARNAGVVVGRAEIAEHVWDERFEPFSNLIEVYIQRLRRKLSEQGEPKLIHTRRGEGYMLAAEELADD